MGGWRRGRERPDLRGHMTVLLGIFLLPDSLAYVEFSRFVSPLWPPKVTRTAAPLTRLNIPRMGVGTIFSLCFLVTPAINSCQVITLCENSSSPVSLLIPVSTAATSYSCLIAHR